MKIAILDSSAEATTFNGIKLPDLAILRENGEIEVVREFGYEEYRRRN